MSRNDSLPINRYRNEILSLIKENDVSIIIGETGSGKSTLLPIFLYEESLAGERNESFKNGNKVIAITQPRRIAAISLAEYVSSILKSDVGDKAGYSVRFKTLVSKNTRIKYLTDGMLIRECITAKRGLFENYSIIIIDEAHERSIRTDFLLGLLKMELNSREKKEYKFKIVIMSATFQHNEFINFFKCDIEGKEGNKGAFYPKIGVYKVPGRQFPVKINYLKEPEVDYLEAIVSTIMTIHFSKPKGDILVFLPGQDDILHLYEKLNNLKKKIEYFYEKEGELSLYIDGTKVNSIERIKLHIQCLYASMPAEEQTKVFETLAENYRKVILSTNISETSVTLPNIVYVIDSGLEKLKYFQTNSNIDALILTKISKASSIQRAGRAGRVKPGEVYRIYTKENYNDLSSSQIPEILRTSLSETLLELIYILDCYSSFRSKMNLNTDFMTNNSQKEVSVKKIMSFPFLSYPNRESIISTLKFLYRLEALDIKGNITELGIKLTMLPVIPVLGKLISCGIEFSCTSEAITLASMLSAECYFDCSIDVGKNIKKPRNDNTKNDEYYNSPFSSSYRTHIKSSMVKYGDHVGLIELYNTWNSLGSSEKYKFCTEVGVSNINMMRAKYIRDQLVQLTYNIFEIKTIDSCILKSNLDSVNNANRDLNTPISNKDNMLEAKTIVDETLQDEKWNPLLMCLTKSFWQNSAKLDNNNKQYITEVSKQIVSPHPSSSITQLRNRHKWVVFSDIVQTKKTYIRVISPINHLWLTEHCSKWFISQ
ncbi:ATP-dependent helicase [Cryptosporidium ryanae]|uniref:ATP-dependent helicase n=1 Tax=Cryptosporidium ryanae TaxID=515981 RepID=UPI00351A5DF2|nr:ATP-dependent helicase [Cryptosporidium ryanae]